MTPCNSTQYQWTGFERDRRGDARIARKPIDGIMSARGVKKTQATQRAAKQSPGSKAGPEGQTARYYVEVLGKALDILDLLRNSRTELRLTDIAEKINLDLSTSFRLLHTLEVRGYVQRDKRTKRFRHSLGYRAYRIGYAQLSSEQPFAKKVTQGLIDTAKQAGIELVIVDNRETPQQAIKSANQLIAEKVDFIIEYQYHSRVAPVLANMFRNAGISTLAIDIPVPNAIFYGADNYAVGHVGGAALALYAKEHWHGQIHRVLLLESAEAGPATHLRIIGSLDGIRGILPDVPERSVLRKNGKGTDDGGYKATLSALRNLNGRERLLIAASNDSTARGALRAIREVRREQFTAIMAQGWGPDEGLEAELRRPGTPLIGAVAYFPESYGAKILPLILRCLNGQPVPPASYTEHKLILRDGLSMPAELVLPPTGSHAPYTDLENPAL